MKFEDLMSAAVATAAFDHHVHHVVIVIFKWVGVHLVAVGVAYLRWRGK